jgi:hypothetical protein
VSDDEKWTAIVDVSLTERPPSPAVTALVAKISDALFEAGLAPSHELAIALLYLGARVAADTPRKAALCPHCEGPLVMWSAEQGGPYCNHCGCWPEVSHE